ncbi:MAG: primase C-terminal domain-containing protein [Elusimicrobia bacterium]|nr:primase C-terminal domain-containing protein [Elusimicrobiota bacterium]
MSGFKSSPDVVDAPASLLKLLQEGQFERTSDTGSVIKSGTRNNTLTSIAGGLRRLGLNAQEILPALERVNVLRSEEPLPVAELERIAVGIERYEPNPDVPWLRKGRFSPAILAQEISRQARYLSSPIDEAGKGVRLYIYAGGVFRPSGADTARRLANQLLGGASKPERIESAVALVNEGCKASAESLNPQALELLNVQNGMLDWRVGELRHHSAEHLSTFQLGASFDPAKRSEDLDRFLSEIFPQDALQLAEELVGYLLRPTTKFQRAFMLLGGGANGKSTFLSLLTAFLGQENTSNVSLQDLVSNRFMAAELEGKLVNIYADLPSAGLEQSDMFKAIVTGDIIKAERKFGQPFKLTPTARLLFSANELPRSRDLSTGYFRRWAIIPFPNRFEGARAKKGLLEQLRTSEVMSALLNRALAGLRRLESQQDFSACASVLEASQTYRRQCDSAFEFITECLELRRGTSIGKTEAHEKYTQWCYDTGAPQPVNQRAFNKRLTEILGVSEGRADGMRVWTGLSWKDGGQPRTSAPAAPLAEPLDETDILSLL